MELAVTVYTTCNVVVETVLKVPVLLFGLPRGEKHHARRKGPGMSSQAVSRTYFAG